MAIVHLHLHFQFMVQCHKNSLSFHTNCYFVIIAVMAMSAIMVNIAATSSYLIIRRGSILAKLIKIDIVQAIHHSIVAISFTDYCTITFNCKLIVHVYQAHCMDLIMLMNRKSQINYCFSKLMLSILVLEFLQNHLMIKLYGLFVLMIHQDYILYVEAHQRSICYLHSQH